MARGATVDCVSSRLAGPRRPWCQRVLPAPLGPTGLRRRTRLRAIEVNILKRASTHFAWEVLPSLKGTFRWSMTLPATGCSWR
jgi:hypothetical protein